MDVLTPGTLDEALRLKAEHPDAWPIQGGTDVMVALNFDRGRPDAMLNLNEVKELRGYRRDNGALRLGSGLDVHVILNVLLCQKRGRDRAGHQDQRGKEKAREGKLSATTRPGHGSRPLGSHETRGGGSGCGRYCTHTSITLDDQLGQSSSCQF